MQTQTRSVREQLDAARAEIARLVERGEAAEREIRALREAVAARDAFIAVAGFELRNPMSAVGLGIANLLSQAQLEAHRGAVPAWVVDRLASLDQRARSFVRRSTTLLDVNRLTTKKVALEVQAVDLGSLVRLVAQEIEPEAARAGSPLVLDLAPGVVGHWDPAALEAIVMNLLSNAVRFGGGAAVDVSVHGADGTAVFEVRDRGPGIADADRDRMFEPFERAVAERECPGFGLGLWIARQLIRAHGGEIAVDGGPGFGSVFTVALPTEPPAASRAECPANDGEGAGNRRPRP
ncbi:MAG TPA: HAMP domain-containing sensor histidine kinase [Polyangiaceae bacterium]|jgi:signal transduction histidine kinase|nr:HAMP domain-containing sensor histidine kinase [Polyangiaceae bacterium]